MNKVILMGRLTKDPEVRYSHGEKSTAVARYSLAVNRTFKREGDPDVDFVNCVAFGRQAEFAEKYFRKGIRIVISGRIQTGSYTNRDGVKVYTTNIVVEEQEFAENKNASDTNNSDSESSHVPKSDASPYGVSPDGFMNIPDNIDEELPFR